VNFFNRRKVRAKHKSQLDNLLPGDSVAFSYTDEYGVKHDLGTHYATQAQSLTASLIEFKTGEADFKVEMRNQ